MPCWVAPSVAAEMWGTPVAHVMDRIADGSVASKTEGGFLFVDLLPAADATEAVAPLEMSPDFAAPDTFTSVTEAELAALTPAPVTFSPVSIELPQAAVAPDDQQHEDALPEAHEPFVDEETPTFSAKDWRRVRAQTARTRRPPASADATCAA